MSSSSSSSYVTTSSPSPSSSSSSFFLANLSNLGLGYAIAIALAALVLLSSLLLASYLCFRRQNHNPNLNPNSINSNGVSIPRIIFVNDDDDEDIEQQARSGLDQAVINSYPKFKYKDIKDSDSNNNRNSANLCSICLCEFREGEMLRMMADCKHYFHLCCIDAWLRLNGSCPICRNSPMPTPLSTPLSEVVPLSQYAADRRRR